ncbi:LysR family transcriptional regulator [Vagococcus vulneris]|uniref:LysR family transcriptional regulator n=1 Tax=Vagococcus vulneris TaxID=1977869 RepID=A0A430A2A2_9ENTE|nr:LysR family transcriptional regulator [Vagococcus vulneris]RSU00589.1 LysR family transcriptional regulator [Vagococcus vulneris]
MELRLIEYFLAVVEQQSITKAADKLHISQPALSKQIKLLEESLNVKLFHRGNRQIHLTSEGRYLASKGKDILDLVSKTTNNLQAHSDLVGEISIGAGETKSIKLIAKAINHLRAAFPLITIKLYSGNADDVIEKLDNGLIDFALTIDPVNKQHYSFIPLMTTDLWGIITKRNSTLGKKEEITSSDLLNEPLLISSQSLVQNNLSEWLGLNINHLNIVGTYNLLYNAAQLTSQNTAHTLCIDGIINTENSDIIFIPLYPEVRVPLNVIWKKNGQLSKPCELFLDYLANEIKKTDSLKKLSDYVLFPIVNREFR